MRIFIACDKYKGSLSAAEVAKAITRGLSSRHDHFEIHSQPIADGGEGFVSALVSSLHGEERTIQARDARGQLHPASWALAERNGNAVAILEMSQASGLAQIPRHQRDILSASTYGTGELIRAAALQPGVSEIVIGLGGSATNDGGIGMIQALGATFRTKSGAPFSGQPRDFHDLAEIDLSTMLPLPRITAACDVENPLLGEEGAAAIFGPQKGADEAQILFLDAALAHIAELSGKKELGDVPGAGAAGGLGFGLMAFAGAQLASGFDIVADFTGLKESIERSDLVITGEGRLDHQSLYGKGPIGVAQLAKSLGKKSVAIAGAVEAGIDWSPYFDLTAAVSDRPVPLQEVIDKAAHYTEQTAYEIAPQLLAL